MWKSDYKSLQGNIGLGVAIAYFTSKGLPVSIPLNDTQKYDLVVEIDGELKKVQIKTTSFKVYSNFTVQLKNSGGSSGKSTIRYFEKDDVDFLFILTIEQDMYLIPSKEINAKSSLSLNASREKYKVSL